MNIRQRRNMETNIARALGWTEITDRFEQLGGSRVGKSPNNPRVLQPIPEYLVDYNAWSWVEDYMQSQFTVEQMISYAAYIERVISDQCHKRTEMLFRMINAPLTIRARAFLEAAGTNLPEPTPEAA